MTLLVNNVRWSHLEYQNHKVGLRAEILDHDGRVHLFDMGRDALEGRILQSLDSNIANTHELKDVDNMLVTEYENKFKVQAVDVTHNPKMIHELLGTRLINSKYTPEVGGVTWGWNIAPSHALYFKNGVLALIQGFAAKATPGAGGGFDIRNRHVEVTWLFMSERHARNFFHALEDNDLANDNFQWRGVQMAQEGVGFTITMPLRKFLSMYSKVSISVGLDYGRVGMRYDVGDTEVQWIVETGIDQPYRHPVFTNRDFYTGQGAKPNLVEINQRKVEARKKYMPLAVSEGEWAISYLQRMRDNGLLTLYRTGIVAPVLTEEGWQRLKAINIEK